MPARRRLTDAAVTFSPPAARAAAAMVRVKACAAGGPIDKHESAFAIRDVKT